MSKYEDYDSVAENYDNHIFSKPLGADVMAALIQLNCEKPLKEIHVLDAGCGTGNYAKALLDLGIGHMTLLDASHGMLNKAQEKLAVEIASGRVKEVKEATIPPLPFPDSSFDAVTFNLRYQKKRYKTLLDPEGPTEKQWRDYNSYWASATENEVNT